MPCLPGLCTHATDCRDRLCPGHPLGSGEGGGYWPALRAEDNFQHLSTPAATAQVKPYIAPEDDEMSDCAKACWAGAAFVVAVIVAAGLVDWLMS